MRVEGLGSRIQGIALQGSVLCLAGQRLGFGVDGLREWRKIVFASETSSSVHGGLPCHTAKFETYIAANK